MDPNLHATIKGLVERKDEVSPEEKERIDFFNRAAGEGDIILDTQDIPIKVPWGVLPGTPPNGVPPLAYVVPSEVSEAAYPKGVYRPETAMAAAIGNPGKRQELKQLRLCHWHRAWSLLKTSLRSFGQLFVLTWKLWTLPRSK